MCRISNPEATQSSDIEGEDASAKEGDDVAGFKSQNNVVELPVKLVPGCAADGTPIHNSQRLSAPRAQQKAPGASTDQRTVNEKPSEHEKGRRSERLLIGVRGNWYDLTNYLPHHPGGDVILDFANRDATAQFLAYHSPSVLKHRKPVGTYEFNSAKPGGEKIQGDWMMLCDKYENNGYYHTPISFVLSRFAILFAFLGVALGCTWVYVMSGGDSLISRVAFAFGAIGLAGFWQQSGFLMHDTMHNLCFHSRKYDQSLGWLCGNVFLGLSSKWWRDEHNEHHLFTNTAVDGVGPSDPQMIEDVWIQDAMIDEFFHPLNQLPKGAKNFLVRYQHLYFVPACMVAGPYAIKGVSLANAGRGRPMEYFGVALHFTWVMSLLLCFPTWSERLLFYGIAMLCLGVLSIQLLVSHYTKPWAEKEATKESGSWAKRQVESVVDISCPLWLDWFHGGLHLHSPHHLFPRLPRCYYREVHKDVLEMCQKNGVVLDVLPWFDAVAATVRHLRSIGEHLESKMSSKKLD